MMTNLDIHDLDEEQNELCSGKWVSVESTLKVLQEILNNVDPEARGAVQGISLSMGIQKMQNELRRT